MSKPTETNCDLCGDNLHLLHLHSRCHFTAPLQATLEGDVVTLRCYVPDCASLVARLRVTEILAGDAPIPIGPEPPRKLEEDGTCDVQLAANDAAIVRHFLDAVVRPDSGGLHLAADIIAACKRVAVRIATAQSSSAQSDTIL